LAVEDDHRRDRLRQPAVLPRDRRRHRTGRRLPRQLPRREGRRRGCREGRRVMVAKHLVPHETPPDLYGRREQDRALRVLNRLADGFLAVGPMLYRRAATADTVSADLRLTVAART